MEQFTQKLKDGKIQILEVPLPVLGAGTVLVQNHYFLVSAGTDGSMVACKEFPFRCDPCWLRRKRDCRDGAFIFQVRKGKDVDLFTNVD